MESSPRLWELIAAAPDEGGDMNQDTAEDSIIALDVLVGLPCMGERRLPSPSQVDDFFTSAFAAEPNVPRPAVNLGERKIESFPL